jgi:hypothetical protein
MLIREVVDDRPAAADDVYRDALTGLTSPLLLPGRLSVAISQAYRHRARVGVVEVPEGHVVSDLPRSLDMLHRLKALGVNLALAERLGGAEVREAVAVALLVGGEVCFVLYGDNAPSGRPRGSSRRRWRASPLPIRRGRAYSRARERLVDAPHRIPVMVNAGDAGTRRPSLETTCSAL